MLKKEDCYFAGTFIKTHGIKGELVAKKNNDLLEEYELGSVLVDIDGGLVPFFVPENGISARNHSSVRIVLEDIDTETKAKRLIGCGIYVLIQDIPDFVEEPEPFNPHMLIGFRYVDNENGDLGEIEDVNDFSGNIVMVLSIKGEEVMIPFAEENFVDLDEDNKTITMITQEGLLDIYF